MSLASRDSKVNWHPYTQMQTALPPIGIVKGEGAWLTDENGRKYLDAISSWWVNIHGHCHPQIADKISKQLKELEHVIFAGFTHPPAVELAENLLKILPGKQSRVFYSDNGSTAVEVAVKMAIQFWHNKGKNKTKFLVFEHAYHGDTFGAMSVSERGSFTKPFSQLLFDVIRLPLPQKEHPQESLRALKKAIIENPGIAAFIFEPLVLGAGGMLMYEPSFLDQMISICRENEILIIADEVMTGFGRTGKNFACDYLKEIPDIICLSKGLTGGFMPMGVTTCDERIYSAFLSKDKTKTFFHGHSYTANPLGCSAGIASLEILLSGECQEAIKRISKSHKEVMVRLQQKAFLQNIRCTGTILAMDYVSGEDTSYFHSMRDRLYDFFLAEGILLRPLGNTLYIMPPYCISNEELNRIYEAIEKSASLFV